MIEKIGQNNIKVRTWRKEILAKTPILHHKIETITTNKSIVIEELLDEVLKFLSLIADHNTNLTPSLIVDLAWHEFILCTKSYNDFCHQKLGRFIHHTPGGDEADNNQKFLKTKQLYVNSFGQPPFNIWGETENSLPTSPQCGGCEAN